MNKNPNACRPRAGFTLVELLVVIVIIAALTALAFSVGPKMMKRAGMTKTIQSLRQIGTLSSVYSSENSGRYVPLRTTIENPDGSFTLSPWPLVLLSMAYPNVDAKELNNPEWWRANIAYPPNS